MRTTLKEISISASKLKGDAIAKIARLYAMGKLTDDEFLELNEKFN